MTPNPDFNVMPLFDAEYLTNGTRLRHRLRHSYNTILIGTYTCPTQGLLAVWLSGNTLASINVVVLRQTRLVLGWVTVCRRVNHLGM